MLEVSTAAPAVESVPERRYQQNLAGRRIALVVAEHSATAASRLPSCEMAAEVNSATPDRPFQS